MAEVELKRTRSMDNEDSESYEEYLQLSEPEAKDIVLRFFLYGYRNNCNRMLASRFLKTHERLVQREEMTYDEMVAICRTPRVVEAADGMILRVVNLLNWDRQEHPLITGTVHVKIFQAAYLIALHPSNVFTEGQDHLSTAALDASRAFLPVFEAAVRILETGTWRDVLADATTANIAQATCTYLREFKAWKVVDEERLANKIRASLRNLARAQRGIEDSTNKDLKTQIKDQIVRLKGKLLLIGGQAVLSAYEEEEKDRMARMAITAAMPTSGGMTNEQLAHEILINPLFELDDDSTPESDDKLVHTRIKQFFAPSFWDDMRQDLMNLSTDKVLNACKEFRIGYANCIGSRHADLLASVEGVLDEDVLQQQVKSGAITVLNCAPLFSSLFSLVTVAHERMKLPGVCKRARTTIVGHMAPIISAEVVAATRWNDLQQKRKDDAMSEWDSLKARMCAADGDAVAMSLLVSETFKTLHKHLYRLRVDTANAKIKGIQPVIQDHGVAYEKSHFRKRMESEGESLDRTKLWIGHSLNRFRDVDSSNVEMVPFIGGALVDLVVEYPHWGGTIRDKHSIDKIPETLRLDLLRIKALNAHFHTDCMCLIIVASVPANVGTWVAEVVKTHPPKPLNPSGTLKLIQEGFVSEHQMTAAEAATLVERLGRNLKRTHAIYEAMRNLLRKYWISIVRTGLANPSEEPKPTPPLVPDAAKGLLEESKVRAMELVPVARVNIKVHEEWYAQMLREALVGA